jgi:hypothetical protein
MTARIGGDETLCRVIQWQEGEKKIARNFCVVLGT